MKANYTKPLLAVEMFSLTQSVTLDCLDSIPVNHNNSVDCGWDVGGGRIFFIEGVQACTENGEGIKGICYNNPSEGHYIFHS